VRVEVGAAQRGLGGEFQGCQGGAGDGGQDVVGQGGVAGCFDHVGKPFSVPVLRQRISTGTCRSLLVINPSVISSDLLAVVVTVEALAAVALLAGLVGCSWWPTGGAATTNC